MPTVFRKATVDDVAPIERLRWYVSLMDFVIAIGALFAFPRWGRATSGDASLHPYGTALPAFHIPNVYALRLLQRLATVYSFVYSFLFFGLMQ